jgi:hypothetical protein
MKILIILDNPDIGDAQNFSIGLVNNYKYIDYITVS